MCKVGDIILVKKYKHDKMILKQHSFIVVEDTNGIINSMSYDFVSMVMGSYGQNDCKKEKKHGYDGNFPLANEDTITNPDNGEDGYVKTDQLYYFKKDQLEFRIMGTIAKDVLELIFEYVSDGKFPITTITSNLEN